MNFTVAEVANILKEDGKTIKDWSYHFAEYLSRTANPSKGEQRSYSLEDVRVFAYVQLYWEDNPDIDNIKYGLNSGSHYEIELIDNLLQEITPIFSEHQDDINIQSSVIFGGMAPLGDILSLANAFKESGDMLVASFLNDLDAYKYISPILYQYRHAIELYLKYAVVTDDRTHNLLKLYSKFKGRIKDEFGEDIPSWFENIILAFDGIDKNGTVFRYGEEIRCDETLVDLRHIQIKMKWFAQSISNIEKQKSLNVTR